MSESARPDWDWREMEPGRVVEHPVYGSGTILAMRIGSGAGGVSSVGVTVRFEDGERRFLHMAGVWAEVR